VTEWILQRIALTEPDVDFIDAHHGAGDQPDGSLDQCERKTGCAIGDGFREPCHGFLPVNTLRASRLTAVDVGAVTPR
jgi:hypothetical protein